MNTSEWRVGVQGIHDEAAGLLNGLRRIWPDIRPVVITHPGACVA
jgi:hypothetical protein